MSRPEEKSAGRERKPRTWTLREASEQDLAGILACREVTFAGEDLEKQNEDYWRWEFLDNHAGPSRLFVAEDAGKIVGHYAVTPQRFVLGDEVLPGSIVVDVMTHPDYRFQGMFTAIGRHALDACTADAGFEFTTGYPIRPEVIPGHLKVGWRIRFEIGTWIMPLSVGRALAARFPKVAAVPGLTALLGAVPSAVARGLAAVRLASRGTHRVERMAECEAPAFDAFWRRVRATLPADCLVQERTAGYLQWRFDANPRREYHYHVVRGPSGEIEGFVVSRAARLLDVDAMIVVDACLPAGADLSLVRALIADVRDRAIDGRCALVATMVTCPDPLFPRPTKLGFVPAPYRFSFITRGLAPVTRSEDDSLTWHLMWGDTDDL